MLDELDGFDKEAKRQEFIDKALDIYHKKDALFLEAECPISMREFEKRALLTSVDASWMEHLEAMDDLKSYVGLNSYAQRDPVAIYRLEAAEMFDKMSHEIRENTVRRVLSAVPRRQVAARVQIAKETGTGNNGELPRKKPVTNKNKRPGRNDPCHCGSGKKYKNCCEQKDRTAN